MRACREWQEQIALAAGSDLTEAEGAALERHVAHCTPCSEELAAIQQSLALLREAHGAPIGEAHFAAVRARVLSRIDTARRTRWVWAAVFAAAATVAAIVCLRPAPVPAPPAIAVAAPPAPAIVLPAGPNRSRAIRAATKGSGRAPNTRVRPLPTVAAPSEPVVVKLLTDDPNVVIYWIGDSQ